MIKIAPDYQMPYQNKPKEKPKQHYAYDGGRFCKVFIQALKEKNILYVHDTPFNV